MCFDYQCYSERCRTLRTASVWEICRCCDGSGYNANTEVVCNCVSGLADMTQSAWPDVALRRSPRLNLAGWCEWCDRRWCSEQRCIKLHRQSHWDLCNRCDGRSFDDPTSEPCTCSHGLIQVR